MKKLEMARRGGADGTTTSTDPDTSYRLAEDDDDMSISSQQTFSTTGGIDVIGDAKLAKKACSETLSIWSGRIVTHRVFKRLVTASILINSVLLGLATFEFISEDPFWKTLFHGTSMLFLVLATLEFALQLSYHQLNILREGWLLFDLSVVVAAWFRPSMLVIRTFRVLRTLRLATSIQELSNLARASLKVIPKIFVIGFLLSILFYISAIVFTDLFGDLYKEGHTSEDYFSRLDISWFSLFQIMTLDQWGDICREVMNVYPWGWIPFVVFVTSTSFFVLNLVIAVVCEAVSAVHQEELLKDPGDKHSDVGTVEGPISKHDLVRLESKIDELTSTIEVLLRMQMAKEQSTHSDVVSSSSPHTSVHSNRGDQQLHDYTLS